MSYLDKKICLGMKEEIEDSIFNDEFGQFIDTLAGLKTDEEIMEEYLGGEDDE